MHVLTHMCGHGVGREGYRDPLPPVRLVGRSLACVVCRGNRACGVSQRCGGGCLSLCPYLTTLRGDMGRVVNCDLDTGQLQLRPPLNLPRQTGLVCRVHDDVVPALWPWCVRIWGLDVHVACRKGSSMMHLLCCSVLFWITLGCTHGMCAAESFACFTLSCRTGLWTDVFSGTACPTCRPGESCRCALGVWACTVGCTAPSALPKCAYLL